jgi:hypothetical protein
MKRAGVLHAHDFTRLDPEPMLQGRITQEAIQLVHGRNSFGWQWRTAFVRHLDLTSVIANMPTARTLAEYRGLASAK